MGRMSKQVKGGKHQPYHTAQFWAGMPTHGKKKSAPTEKGKKGKTKSLSFRYMTSIFNIEYCNQGIAYSQQDEGGGAEETHRARSTALFGVLGLPVLGVWRIKNKLLGPCFGDLLLTKGWC